MFLRKIIFLFLSNERPFHVAAIYVCSIGETLQGTIVAKQQNKALMLEILLVNPNC
jgi:hypothetical protein